MLTEKEGAGAKYTPSGKRKFKAKVLSVQDKSLGVFSRSATTPQATPAPNTLEKLKFRMTKKDHRKKEEEGKPLFNIPEESVEKPQERERHLPRPDEAFKPTSEDFRSKD